MKQPQKAAAQELISFLSAYQLHELLKNPQLIEQIKKSFKRYYPLLLLERAIERRAPWPQEAKTTFFHLYFKETISDVCQAMVLSSQGYYKPAQLSLRSGLENWIRCVGLAQDQSVLSLKSVYELIDLVRSTPIISGGGFPKQYFDTLRNRYSQLCGYVHTTNAAHMALTTAAGSFPRYMAKEANSTFHAIEEVCSRITWIFCIIAKDTFRGMHHTHFDIVSDALPNKLKAHLHRD